MKTGDLKIALKNRYRAPEWAVLFEVANGTGATACRYADAVAMNLFPSRGLRLHGFEIKAQRGDWLRELRNPEKAEDVSAYCDHWWLVAAPDVVHADEVPDTWGLLVADGGKLKVKKQAPELHPEGPKPLTHAFLAALLRRSSEVDDDVINAMVAERTKNLTDDLEWRVERRAKERTMKYDSLRAAVEAFENGSGLKIDQWESWRNKRLGEVVKVAEAVGSRELHGTAHSLLNTAKALVRDLEELPMFKESPNDAP